MKLLDYFQKRTVAIPVIIFVVVSIMAAGTYAWISLVQRITNTFEYEPYDVRLIKLDSVTKERLMGAEFQLFNQAGIVIGQYTTDVNGEIEISNLLEEGKPYYFRETKAPDGYLALTGDIPFTASSNEIMVENTAMPTLTISKMIAAQDIEGNQYDFQASKNKADLEFPFKFSVDIGDDPNAEYSYSIYQNYNPTKKTNEKIKDYAHPDTGEQIASTGKIKSGGYIYLRHGDAAVIRGTATGTFYRVAESDVCEVTLDENISDDGFHCDTPEHTAKHTKSIGTAVGWASFGNTVSGYIVETGSTAKFENIKVPSGTRVTISSLVVIDRIVDEPLSTSDPDYGRRLAYDHQIDYAQGFQVRVTIGEDKNQSYYYEVVYTDDAQRADIDKNNHEHKSDYYIVNDPHPHWHSNTRSFSAFNAVLSGIDTVRSAFSGISSSFASVLSNASYKAPLHKPSAYERWTRRDGAYEGTLEVSKGNVIEVDLHHQAAVIIYGIPTFTKYTAEQVKHWNNGYIFHSDYKASGVILPDLNRVPDPHYPEYIGFVAAEMQNLQSSLDTSEPPPLWRTRADIFNYYPHNKEIVLEKVWDDENDANNRRPGSVDITVTGTDSGNRVFERTVTLSHADGWKKTLIVPRYGADQVTEIVYSAAEQQADGYKLPAIEKTQLGFQITNTYEPDKETLVVKKNVNGSESDKNKSFTFTAEIGGTKSTFSLRDGEQRAFTDLPVGTPYTITEDQQSSRGYSVSTKNSSGTIPSGGVTAVFTNTKATYEEDETGDLTVYKLVEGVGADTDREFRFTVTIEDEKHVFYLRSGESETFYDIPVGTRYSVVENKYAGYTTSSSGASGTITRSGNTASFTNTNSNEKKTGSLTVTKTVRGEADRSKRFDFTVMIGRYQYRITLSDGERYTFTDIPVGTKYSVKEASYAAQGYFTNATGTSGTISQNGNTADFTNTKGEVHDGTGGLTVTKTITGQFVDTTKKFRFVVEIGQDKHEFFLKHGESRVFADVPAGTPYTVIEDDYSAQDYVTTSRGATGTVTGTGATADFINEYVGNAWPKPDDDAVQISGKKSWIHRNNTNPPQSITVFVMDGSTIVTQKTVTARDNWSYGFNLPKFAADGREILYGINEDIVKDYSKTVKGYDLENTYNPTGNPGTGDQNVLWIWFIILLVGSVGLRVVVFYRKKRKGTR